MTPIATTEATAGNLNQLRWAFHRDGSGDSAIHSAIDHIGMHDTSVTDNASTKLRLPVPEGHDPLKVCSTQAVPAPTVLASLANVRSVSQLTSTRSAVLVAR